MRGLGCQLAATAIPHGRQVDEWAGNSDIGKRQPTILEGATVRQHPGNTLSRSR